MKYTDILGNEKVKDILKKAVQHNTVLHSYLFVGEEGIGKSLFAKEFAKSILCLGKEKPCEACKSCIEIEENNQPDYIEIVPDGNSIKIEQIRNMQLKVAEKPIVSTKKVYVIQEADTMTQEAQNALLKTREEVNFLPTLAKYRVYIIDEVHMLSTGAFNALLKTLEEPPEYITIILIASNENSILNTIKSRCTKIVFEPLSNEELKKYAQEYWKDATIPEEVFASSMGSIARLRNNIEHQELYTNVYQCINQIENKSLLDFLKQAESIAKAKEESDAVLEFLVSILFSLAKEKTEKKQNYLNCVEIVDNTKKNLQFNSNYDMQIDTMLIKMWEEIHEKSYWC